MLKLKENMTKDPPQVIGRERGTRVSFYGGDRTLFKYWGHNYLWFMGMEVKELKPMDTDLKNKFFNSHTCARLNLASISPRSHSNASDDSRNSSITRFVHKVDLKRQLKSIVALCCASLLR